MRVRKALPAHDPALILVEPLVALSLNSRLGKAIDCLLDVRDGEVQDGEGRRLVVRLGVDDDLLPAAQVKGEDPILLGYFVAQRVGVERLPLREALARD